MKTPSPGKLESVSPSRAATAPGGAGLPPCFYFRWCARRAALEKAGRSVCRPCAAMLRGQEYPLRGPGREPLYLTGRAAAEAADMRDDDMETRGNADVERALLGKIREAPHKPPPP